MAESSARVSFVTPADKRQRLDEIATTFGKKLSAVINEALDLYIETHEWQVNHIQKGVDAVKRGEFATDEEVSSFFEQYGEPS